MDNDIQELLTTEMAQQICDILHEETRYPVIVTNQNGIIFAATFRNRIGNFHPVAKKVMDGEIAEGVVTKEQEEQSGGAAKAGINIPIVYRGKRIANMGISGDPIQVRPVVGIASRITQLWLQNAELLKFLSESITNVNTNLQEIAASVEEITASAQQVAASSQHTSQIAMDSKGKMKDIEEVLEVIKRIAAQSNLIGLNAAIEAARVGEAGRGFSVVANEVRKLATSSSESVENIARIVGDIQDIFNTIAGKIEDNKEITFEQSSALMAMSERIQSIETTMTEIIQEMKN